MTGSARVEVLGESAANAALEKPRSATINRSDFMMAVPSLVAVLRIVLVASTLTLVAAPAFPQLPKAREEALAQLASADATARIEAIAWFADHGAMADAKLLNERLRDDDPYVRDYAERGLWAI